MQKIKGMRVRMTIHRVKMKLKTRMIIAILMVVIIQMILQLLKKFQLIVKVTITVIGAPSTIIAALKRKRVPDEDDHAGGEKSL